MERRKKIIHVNYFISNYITDKFGCLWSMYTNHIKKKLKNWQRRMVSLKSS